MPDESEQIGRLRNGLADRLFVNRPLSAEPAGAERVEQAFRAVSRHQFLPGVGLVQAYEDEAIVTVREVDGRPLSSSSQPLIMAIMLEQLGVGTGERVLEIGAGTGYNAALLAHVVGESGHVTTVDIDEEIVDRAREHLRAAGFDGVSVVTADGADGYRPGAPYDRIILTVGAADVPSAWADQLAGRGRIVLPLSLRGIQRSIALEKAGDRLESVSVVDCGFMPIRGALAGAAPPFRPVRGDPLMFLVLDDDRRIDTVPLAAGLDKAREESPAVIDTGLSVTRAEAAGGLSLWTVLHDYDAGQLTSVGDPGEQSSMPLFVRYPGFAHTVVLVGEVPGGKPAMAALVGMDAQGGSFRVGVLPVGDGARKLAERLAGLVRGWDESGRPSSDTVRISVFPSLPSGIARPPVEPARTSGQTVIDKPNSRIVVDW